MDELDKPVKKTVAMRAGLARMYADEELRSYLVNLVKVQRENTLVCVGNGKHELARAYHARMKAIELLLSEGFDSYTHLNELKPSTKVVR